VRIDAMMKGQQLVRIIRRGSGSVVAWRQAQTLLLSAQGMGLFQAKAWLSLAGRFLGIARPNRPRWGHQAQQPESWLWRRTQ
jgi:hypothetical protein